MGKIDGRRSRDRSRRRCRVLVGETEGAEEQQASHQPVDWHPRPEGADSPHSFLCSMSIAGRSCLPTQTLPVNCRSCNLEMTIELSRWRGGANHGETKSGWSRGGRGRERAVLLSSIFGPCGLGLVVCRAKTSQGRRVEWKSATIVPAKPPLRAQNRSQSNGFWSSACNCFSSRGDMREMKCMRCQGAGISGSIPRRVNVQ